MNHKLLSVLNSCRSCFIFSILLGAGLTASSKPGTSLTVQIVNDSGLSDSNIYIMVPGAKTGASIDPQSLFVDKNNGTNTAVPLSSLGTNSWGTATIVSPVSGNTDTVYSFRANYITSGAIYFIYNHPFDFNGGVTPSPAPDGGNGGSGFRYDYAELSFLGGKVNNDVDLTYVDKFGIPLQLEWFHGTNTAATNLLAGSYVYASTKTLANLFTANGFANAVFSLTNAGAANGNITAGWQSAGGTNPYASFARIVSPEKISGIGDSVSPYPGVTNYLNLLTNHPFTLNGYSVQGGSVLFTNTGGTVFTTNYLYYYLGYETTVTPTISGGWTFTLSYNTNLLPANYDLTAIGATTDSGNPNVVDIPLPYTNTITFTIPETNSTVSASAFIYGAPVGTNYLVDNTPVTDDTHTSYNVEVWMIGDVLSAINFGFAGGIYGSDSDQWFSPDVAWPNPFGWAQPSPYKHLTTAHYNPYAALMYYNADAYTFAFSERITPDVGMAVEAGDTIRITILPDDRLDSPVVSILTNTVTPTSVKLNWSPVAGATGYRVNMLRPTGSLGFAPTNVSAATTNYTFTGLSNGAPYVMSVQAIGTNANNGNTVITPARPVHATTGGTYNPVVGGTIPVLFALNASDPFSQLASVSFNGTVVEGWKTNNSTTISYNASAGTNEVLVTLKDANTNILFNDWLHFVAAAPFPFTNIGTNLPNGTSPPPTNAVIFVSSNSAISGIVLGGQLMSALPPAINGGWPEGSIGPVLATNDEYAIWVTNYTGNATNFLVSVNGNQVIGNPGPTINLSYGPAEVRQFAPENTVNLPPVNPVVTITGITPLPDGRIQFNFNVPAGTNYVVESSGNLITWQTIFTGTGQPGGQASYTNNAGTNTMQFYRIKL